MEMVKRNERMHVKAVWWDRKASSQNSVGQKASLTCKEVVWSWPLQTGSGGGEVKGGRMNPTGGWLTVDYVASPNSAAPAHKYLWPEDKRQASEWAWVEAQPFPPLLVLSEPMASWDSSSFLAQAEFIHLVGSAQKRLNHTWESPFAEWCGTTGRAAAASISKLLSAADFSLSSSFSRSLSITLIRRVLTLA